MNAYTIDSLVNMRLHYFLNTEIQIIQMVIDFEVYLTMMIICVHVLNLSYQQNYKLCSKY